MQEKNRHIEFVKARPPLFIVIAVGIFLFGFIVKAVASLFHLHGAGGDGPRHTTSNEGDHRFYLEYNVDRRAATPIEYKGAAAERPQDLRTPRLS